MIHLLKIHSSFQSRPKCPFPPKSSYPNSSVAARQPPPPLKPQLRDSVAPTDSPHSTSSIIHESQKALIEYIHATKCIPFFSAKQIATNSLLSLLHLLCKIHFSVPTFQERIHSILKYQPLNEFEFFFESIGIDHRHLAHYLPPDKLFLLDGSGAVLDSAVALSCRIGDCCGFHNLTLISACLAFPRLLAQGGDSSPSSEALFEDLKRIFEGFEDLTSMEGNVDCWYEVCHKVFMFYNLGYKGGTIGDLMCRGKQFIAECPSLVLENKANYFLKFGVGGVKVESLLLKSPELLA